MVRATPSWRLRALSLLAGIGAACGATGADFTGTWEMADAELVVKPTLERPQAEYTPEAWARIEHFRKYYDLSRGPTSFCVIEGMPYNMTARGRFYLTDIYQNRDRVTILFEFEDNYRIVYLDGRSLPEAWVPSANGFSSGHWEGETPALVIRTTGLKPMLAGLQQRSGDAVIVERWHLERDPRFGEILVDDLAVSDPPIFRGVQDGTRVLKRAATGATLMGYGRTDHFWDQYIHSHEMDFAAPGWHGEGTWLLAVPNGGRRRRGKFAECASRSMIWPRLVRRCRPHPSQDRSRWRRCGGRPRRSVHRRSSP